MELTGTVAEIFDDSDDDVTIGISDALVVLVERGGSGGGDGGGL